MGHVLLNTNKPRVERGARPLARFLQLAVAAAVVATACMANASEALAKKYACAACHQAERKVVGPAWKEVASKYGGGSVTPEQLAASIKKGSSGKWGTMAMPPQAQVSDADLLILSTWVLGGGK
jgi:cytochrome c